MSYPLRLSEDVEQSMKQLAGEHGRSLNNEIVQACKFWVLHHQGEGKMVNYEEFALPFMSELSKNSMVNGRSRTERQLDYGSGRLGSSSGYRRR